jgi:hypothetical protein
LFSSKSSLLLLEIKNNYKNLYILFERILLWTVRQGDQYKLCKKPTAQRDERERDLLEPIISGHTHTHTPGVSGTTVQSDACVGSGRRPEAIHVKRRQRQRQRQPRPVARSDRSVSDQCDRDAVVRRELACPSARSRAVRSGLLLPLSCPADSDRPAG